MFYAEHYHRINDIMYDIVRENKDCAFLVYYDLKDHAKLLRIKNIAMAIECLEKGDTLAIVLTNSTCKHIAFLQGDADVDELKKMSVHFKELFE
ncbi:MAG TPA: hypothetical protein PLV55_05915 [Anaerohalosphaeraceae bacterium]|nr:hypothetical protein [Anaerohalosphaeraceae bacterium]